MLLALLRGPAPKEKTPWAFTCPRQASGRVATFDSASAALWAARARQELARVSGRAPGNGELSTTELRVAELVARGMSNREAAAELFVTVRAIESTLTKVYAKLGVQSRTQLASYPMRRA